MDNVSLGLLYMKIAVNMPCYDFIVKSKNPGSGGLWGPFWKGDEPYKALNGLELFVSVFVSIHVLWRHNYYSLCAS